MENPKEKTTQLSEITQKKYRAFNDYVAFREGDPLWMLGYKLVLRFMGIIFMILISPFVILGLVIAFLAVL